MKPIHYISKPVSSDPERRPWAVCGAAGDLRMSTGVPTCKNCLRWLKHRDELLSRLK